jgi:hypothetical protein
MLPYMKRAALRKIPPWESIGRMTFLVRLRDK